MTLETNFIEAKYKYSPDQAITTLLNPVIELSLKGLNPDKEIVVKKTIQLAGILGKCFDFFYGIYHSHKWVKINFKQNLDRLAVWVNTDDLKVILGEKYGLDKTKSIEELITSTLKTHADQNKSKKITLSFKNLTNLKNLSPGEIEQNKINAFLKKHKILEKYQPLDNLSDTDPVFFKATKRMTEPVNSLHTKAQLYDIWKEIALNKTKGFITINNKH